MNGDDKALWLVIGLIIGLLGGILVYKAISSDAGVLFERDESGRIVAIYSIKRGGS